jgi:hypothetical protein
MATGPTDKRSTDSKLKASPVQNRNSEAGCVLEWHGSLPPRAPAGAYEAKCALEALFTRWPTLQLAVPEADIKWRERPGIRAIRSLPVEAS